MQPSDDIVMQRVVRGLWLVCGYLSGVLDNESR